MGIRDGYVIDDPIGQNSADNDFDSSSVGPNSDGSLLERLEALKDLVTAVTAGQVIVQGAVDAAASSTTIIPIAGLSGYGNDFFNNQYYLQVLCNKNSAGNAPEKEVRKITDYVSTTGTFTCDAFSQVVEATDLCLIIHESLVAVGRNDNNNVFDSSTAVANASGSLIEMVKDVKAAITTLTGYVDLEVAAIQAVTDNLPDAGALTAIVAAIDTIDNFVDAANLEKLTGAADGTDVYPAAVAQDSVFAKIMGKGNPAVASSFDNTTDSLEAISDAIATVATYIDTEVATLGTKIDTIDDFLDGAALEKLSGAADGGTQLYPDSVAQDSQLAYILSKADPAVKTSYNNSTDSLEAISDAIAALTETQKLDKLIAADDRPAVEVYPSSVIAESILNFIMSKTLSATSFDYSTDSLEAIADAVAYVKNIQVIATGTLTTDSATVPADTTLGAAKATGYYNGCILMPLTGACAFQPRRIKTFATTTGIMTLETETPFTGVPGLSTYVILADTAIVGFNTAVPATPTAGSLYDALSKAAGGNTFDKTTDSLEAISDKITTETTALTNFAAAGGDGSAVVRKTVTFANTAVDANLFSITGGVTFKLYAYCTTNVESAAGCNIGVDLGTGVIIADTDCTTLEANDIWHDATPDASVELDSVHGKRDAYGGTIVLDIEGAKQVDSGVIEFVCVYTPITSNGAVAAA